MRQQVTTKNAEKMPEYMYFTEVLIFLCRPHRITCVFDGKR